MKPRNYMEVLKCLSDMLNNESTWIYDSGAIVHITNDRSLLTNFNK